MSVINRMLQELEERHDDAAQHRLPGVVRAVPARLSAASYRAAWQALLIIGLALVVGFLSWVLATTWKARQAVPAAAGSNAPSPVLATPTTLEPQLKPSGALMERAPLPAPPEPVVAPRAAKPAPAAAIKSAPEFPTPAREEHSAGAKPEAVIKTSPGAESVTASMKQVSKEQRADFRYREALSLITQGRMQEAQAALEEALRLDPRNLNARQVLLGLLLESKRYPQAEQLLQEALQLNLAPATHATALARVQFERGDQTAALATLEKYALQASGSSEYHGLYAALLQRAGRHAEAIGQFQAALKIQPNHANWLMGLGISLQSEKRYAEAAQAYSRARASNTLMPDLQAFVEQRLQQVQHAPQ